MIFYSLIKIVSLTVIDRNEIEDDTLNYKNLIEYTKWVDEIHKYTLREDRNDQNSSFNQTISINENIPVYCEDPSDNLVWNF